MTPINRPIVKLNRPVNQEQFKQKSPHSNRVEALKKTSAV